MQGQQRAQCEWSDQTVIFEYHPTPVMEVQMPNKGDCSSGSTTCGDCLTGFKADGTSCVDMCDTVVQNGCASVNKAACSAGTTTCGDCLTV